MGLSWLKYALFGVIICQIAQAQPKQADGCVRPLEYWRQNPWPPVDASGETTESYQFCEAGPNKKTYRELVDTTEPDTWEAAMQQLVVTQQNILKSAKLFEGEPLVEVLLATLKEGDLQLLCCKPDENENFICTEQIFDDIKEFLENTNEGEMAIPLCPDVVGGGDDDDNTPDDDDNTPDDDDGNDNDNDNNSAGTMNLQHECPCNRQCPKDKKCKCSVLPGCCSCNCA